MIILRYPFLKGIATLSLVYTKEMDIILVRYKNKSIGHIGFRREDGTDNFGNIIYVDNVDVEEKFQKKGVGRIMMELVIYIAKHEKRNIVLTSTNWAIPFYHKMKFRRYDDSNKMVFRV